MVEDRIHSLLRDDYDFQLIQELLAELVLKTQSPQMGSPESRFASVMETLFGAPQKKKYLGVADDEELLMYVAHLVVQSKRALKTACLIVAKMDCIADYRPPYKNLREWISRPALKDKMYAEQSDTIYRSVEALQKRLYRKSKKIDIDEYAKKYSNRMIKKSLRDCGIRLDDDEAQKLIAHWLERNTNVGTKEPKNL